MFRNILIPADGSDLAAKAVEQGVLFAKEIGAKITAMTVTEPFELVSVSQIQLEYTPIEYQKYSKAHAEKVLGIVSDAAKLAGVVCDTLHVEHEQVYQAIIEAAEARRCDLIVMPHTGVVVFRQLFSAAKRSKSSPTRRSPYSCIASGMNLTVGTCAGGRLG